MLVYRIENKHGEGLWAAYEGELVTGHEGLHTRGRTVGSPFFMGDHYRYGCESLEALVKYFGTALAPILESGKFFIAKYKVRKNYVQMSEIELIFDIRKAQKIEDVFRPLNQLYGDWRDDIIKSDEIRRVMGITGG